MPGQFRQRIQKSEINFYSLLLLCKDWPENHPNILKIYKCIGAMCIDQFHGRILGPSSVTCRNWQSGNNNFHFWSLHHIHLVRLAEWSKAWDLSSHNRKIAWVRTPHLTNQHFYFESLLGSESSGLEPEVELPEPSFFLNSFQWRLRLHTKFNLNYLSLLLKLSKNIWQRFVRQKIYICRNDPLK